MKKKFLGLKYIKKEEGFVLITILMIFVIVSILGIGLLSVSTSNFRQTGSERDFQAVYYIAEAGINQAIYDIGIKVDELSDETLSHVDFFEKLNDFIDTYMGDDGVKTLDNFEESFGEKPVATISVVKADDGLVIEDEDRQTKGTTNYVIRSVGKIGRLSRTVSTSIKVAHGITKETESSHHPAFDYALFSASNKTFKDAGGAKISGSVYAHDIEFDATNSKIDGDIVSEKSINLKSAVKVKGNIYAMDGFVKLSNSDIEMKGDIHATEDVTLSHGTTVDGNIYTNSSITLNSSNAKVTGDIHAGGNVSLGSNANVKNIYAEGDIILGSSAKVENIFTSGRTTLNSSNTVNGDIHSMGNVTLGSNVNVKNIFTNGNVYFSSWGYIVNGNIHAAGDVVGNTIDSGGVTVNGSIFSSSNVITKNYKTFKIIGDINAAGNVENGNNNIINGNVISGKSIINRGSIYGTITENGNPVEPTLPTSPISAMQELAPPQFDAFKSINSEIPLHSFEIGTNNITLLEESMGPGVQTITPDYYKDLIITYNNTVRFLGGNYYFDNINANQSEIKLQLDLSNGPINIYAKENIDFGGRLEVSISQDGINYTSIGELLSSDPGLAIELAGQVHWESHNNFKIAEYCYFFGSVLANNDFTTTYSPKLIGAYAVNKGTISMGYESEIIYAPPTDSAAGSSGGSGDVNEEGQNSIPSKYRITTSSPIREK